MIEEAKEILISVKAKITDESDLDWTPFETAVELRKEIDRFIVRLNQGDREVVEDIYVHFLPTSTFQEHAIQNGWTEEYMKLAEQFDKLYEQYR